MYIYMINLPFIASKFAILIQQPFLGEKVNINENTIPINIHEVGEESNINRYGTKLVAIPNSTVIQMLVYFYVLTACISIVSKSPIFVI